jgi:hypothetical protein
MERVTFLVERTGDRIPCLLNPESLEVRRSAGIVRRRGAGGAIIGNPRTDDPLVATGGGVTEYELKLLFDVDILASQSGPGTLAPAGLFAPAPADGMLTGLEDSEEGAATEGAEGAGAAPAVEQTPTPAPNPPSIDVRTLTQPLWSLAENGQPVAGILAPQRIRFIWGCSWNVPGVIVAVAERLECFDPQGVPKRSWLNLLLRRVEEELEGGSAPPPPTSPQFEVNSSESAGDSGDDSVVLPVDDEGVALTPLHVVAAERYGDPRYNRAIAEYNDLDDLLELEEGQPIRLPPASAVARVSEA